MPFLSSCVKGGLGGPRLAAPHFSHLFWTLDRWLSEAGARTL